jgi:deazaflavin-dependent oxidoreductase (nitroreductase family)
MADTFLYLTTTGRTSGLPRTIEIWFVEHAGRHFLVSEHRGESHWIKNLQNDPRVRFSVGTREAPDATLPPTAARGRVVTDDGSPDLVREVRAKMNAKYAWSEGWVVELTPDPASP